MTITFHEFLYLLTVASIACALIGYGLGRSSARDEREREREIGR